MTEFTDPVPTAAVVVNFRTADDTVAAVRSLQSSNPPVSSIIVVDNGSGDDSVRRIASRVTDIELIEEPENRGFAGGCNVGIRQALLRGAGQVLLLNSDATVTPATVVTMERLLQSDPQLGIVGPVIVSKAQPARIESFGISFSLTTGRMWNQNSGQALSSIARPDRRDVDAISGCAMLITRLVFERVGLFDEAYFFGFEDIDFCLRSRRDHFGVAVAGNAIVEHEGQASIGRRSEERIYFATRNHLRLVQRCSSDRSRPLRMLQTTGVLGFNFANALVTSDVPRRHAFRGFFRGAGDHFAGRYGTGK